MLFADTSFFVAVLHGRDQFHLVARDAYVNNQEGIVTSDWIVIEVCNYFSRGTMRSLAYEFLEWMETDNRLHLIGSGKASYDAGKTLFLTCSDKDWLLTDCITMALMSEYLIRDVLTTDHHFEQAGYNVLLRN